MRHNVNRAKVHIINKLTRDIKKLRTKKAIEQLKIKNEKKADRLVNEVLVMKKIPPDEVAAFSLSNTKNVDDILKDIESSSRLKGLARLSSHKSISPIVQHFRIKYPSWEKEFPKVLIALKKHEKQKIKNKKKTSSSKDSEKNIAFTKDSAKKEINKDSSNLLDNERSDDELPKENSYVFTRGNRFSVSSDDFNMLVSSQNESVLEGKNINRVRSRSNSLNFQEEPVELESNKSNDNSVKISLPERESVDENEMDYSVGENRLNQEEKGKSWEISPGKSKVINSSKVKRKSSEILRTVSVIKRKSTSPTPQIKKKVDPFFLVGDNQPYEALDPVFIDTRADFVGEENESNFDSGEEVENKGRMKQFVKKPFNSNKKFNQDTVKTRRDFHKPKEKLIKNTIPETRIKDKMPSGKLDVKLLHPSWQAKKKISTLADFQGKKIVFD